VVVVLVLLDGTSGTKSDTGNSVVSTERLRVRVGVSTNRFPSSESGLGRRELGLRLLLRKVGEDPVLGVEVEEMGE